MSEYNFQGISSKAINLLCQNRFEDSRAFYEEHIEELNNTEFMCPMMMF